MHWENTGKAVGMHEGKAAAPRPPHPLLKSDAGTVAHDDDQAAPVVGERTDDQNHARHRAHICLKPSPAPPITFSCRT